jgi:hypothetical protein
VEVATPDGWQSSGASTGALPRQTGGRVDWSLQRTFVREAAPNAWGRSVERRMAISAMWGLSVSH